MSQLSCGNADEIASEFDALLGAESELSTYLACVPAEYSKCLRQLSTKCILHNATGFERRVRRKVQAWPHKFCQFGKTTRHDVPCEHRQLLANELLNAGDDLEINAKKVVRLYNEEIVHVANTGVVPPRLWSFIRMYRCKVCATTRSFFCSIPLSCPFFFILMYLCLWMR